MFARNSLRIRLIISFVIFALIPACIGGIVSTYLNLADRKAAVIGANLNTAHLMANQLERLLDDSRATVETLAASPTAKSMDVNAIREMIMAAKERNPQFELIFIMDTKGMQVVKTSGKLLDRSERQYFKEAMQGKTFFTDTYISSGTNAPTVTIATPIKDNTGAIVGVFAADVSLQAIWDIADGMHVGKTGYVDVVDNKGVAVAHPDKQRVQRMESFAELDYVKKAIAGDSGFVDAVSTRGDNSLTVYAPVGKFNWGVIVHQPMQEVYGPIIKTTSIMGVVMLIAIAAAIGLAFVIARSIVKPIQALVAAADKVAKGDLTHSITINGQGEIGTLAAEFSAMTAALREIIARALATAQSVAAAAQELAASAGEVGKASEEVATNIQHVANGAANQVQLSEQSLHVIEDMVASAGNTVHAAEAVAAASEQSVRVAEGGARQVQEAIDKMTEIQKNVDSTTVMIHSLGEKSRQIGQIVDVITGIAGQTNLLALNAAIEAARAGEQGRGFAVVADEVRKLAEQSEAAAKEIASIIRDIQTNTGEVVQAMDRGSQHVADGVQVVQASGEAFKEIYQAINNMKQEVARIVTLAETQQADSSQVQQAVQRIADAGRLNATSAEQVAAASQEQNASVEEIAASTTNVAKLAADLQEAVIKFKV